MTSWNSALSGAIENAFIEAVRNAAADAARATYLMAEAGYESGQTLHDQIFCVLDEFRESGIDVEKLSARCLHWDEQGRPWPLAMNVVQFLRR